MTDTDAESRGRRSAFISYSREADGDLAPDIKRSLQRLSNPWYQRRAFIDVVLDTDSWGASHDLDETIYDALDSVDHLVLLLSAGSANSPWTAKEAAHWLKSKDPEKITYVITEWVGDLNDFEWSGKDVPEPLRAANKGRVPLAVDLRWARTATDRSLDNEDWASDMAQIAADIKDVEKDQLVGELVALRTRARLLTGSILLGLLILLIAIGVSIPSWYVARQAAAQAESDREVAEGARDDADLARTAAEGARDEAETARIAAIEAEAEARLQADEADRLAAEAAEAQLTAESLQAAAESNLTDAQAATLLAEEAQATADRLKIAAEDARDTADAARTEAEALAAEAEAAAEAADLAAFGSKLDAGALQNLDDDPQLALNLAVAGYCRVNDGCATEAGTGASRTVATAADLESMRTLLLVAQASRGIEQHLTADSAVTAAISADGSTVVVAVRPAAGSDRIERYVSGRLSGSLSLDSWSEGFDVEVEALALSDDGARLAVLAWPSGGPSSSALFGSTDMSGETDVDMGTPVELGGGRQEYPDVQLYFQPGSRRHLLLQARRIDIVCCNPDANVHVLVDLQATEPGALGQFLINGPAAFTNTGSLLTAEQSCVVEQTVPGFDRVGETCLFGDETTQLLSRATIGSGQSSTTYSIIVTNSLLSIETEVFGTRVSIAGEDAIWIDVAETAAEIRVGFADGTVSRWSLDGTILGSLEGGRTTTASDREVVFGPKGAALHSLTGDPVSGWATIGFGSTSGSIEGGFAVVGGQVRTAGGRRTGAAQECPRCDVAVSGDGGVIVFSNGVVSNGTTTSETITDLPDGFDVDVVASATGAFAAFAQPSIQVLPPTQNSTVVVVDLGTGERASRSDFSTDGEDVVLLGVTDQGVAILTVSGRQLFMFDATTDEFRMIDDYGPATSILDAAIVGSAVWVLDSNGVVQEFSLNQPDQASQIRLERVGFSSARSLDVVPDGSLIAIGLDNGTVELWEPGASAPLVTGLAEIDQRVDQVRVSLTTAGVAVMSIADGSEDAGVVALQRIERDLLLSGLCSAANRGLTDEEWRLLGGAGAPLGC